MPGDELLIPYEDDLALGLFADYRTEMILVSKRLKFINQNKNSSYVMFHSLIDSLIYPTIRFHSVVNSNAPNEDDLLRWTLTTHLNAMALKDTHPTEAEIFFLKRDGLDEYATRVQDGLETLLTDWGFSFTTWYDSLDLTSKLYDGIKVAKLGMPINT